MTTGSAASDSQVPLGHTRWRDFVRRCRGQSPFGGTLKPGRVRLFDPDSGRPTAPFPHPWNYHEPLDILESFFWDADRDPLPTRHTRYLEIPGMRPVLATRDPRLIKAISADTGDKPGQFDRDTMPSAGIARATGEDTLLYANGPVWKRQKKLATPPFARTTLFQPEQFRGFADSFRVTVRDRLSVLRQRVGESREPLQIQLEPEIKALMLEMLVNNFFGASVPYREIRDRFVPALELVIDDIVRDTVLTRVGIRLDRVPALTEAMARVRQAKADFERLTDLVIATRPCAAGQWGHFRSDAPDEALRSNVRVFLAGALEATTSYASWAISHLARDPVTQERVYQEVRDVEDYTPETLTQCKQLGYVLDETLRLSPSLYFHPRRATVHTTVELSAEEAITMPAGTHVLLDVWHANRHEDHWGIGQTGYPASEFHPQRWERMEQEGRPMNEWPHFGFGHGPRFCPGKSLGQLETALVVGTCVKLFQFTAPNRANLPRAGVSTKPRDGVLVDLTPRASDDRPSQLSAYQQSKPRPDSGGCPFSGR